MIHEVLTTVKFQLPNNECQRQQLTVPSNMYDTMMPLLATSKTISILRVDCISECCWLEFCEHQVLLLISGHWHVCLCALAPILVA